MALGKLTFLCLNAICIGTLALLVLGAFIRMYGRQSERARSTRRASVTGLCERQLPPMRVVDRVAGSKDDERGRGRFEREPRREASYEFEFRR